MGDLVGQRTNAPAQEHERVLYQESMKKKTKSIRILKGRAWKVFSEYIRRSSADDGGTVACYTCGRFLFWKESHAGHALPGRHNAVLFDEGIVKPQCQVCNIWKAGNYPIFTTKLIKENGMEWWEKKLEGARQLVKLTRSDIEDLIESYKAKLKELPA